MIYENEIAFCVPIPKNFKAASTFYVMTSSPNNAEHLYIQNTMCI